MLLISMGLAVMFLYFFSDSSNLCLLSILDLLKREEAHICIKHWFSQDEH